MDPQPIRQHAGIQHAGWQLQQEVTGPKARFKPTSPKKSGVDGAAIRCQNILVSWNQITLRINRQRLVSGILQGLAQPHFLRGFKGRCWSGLNNVVYTLESKMTYLDLAHRNLYDFFSPITRYTLHYPMYKEIKRMAIVSIPNTLLWFQLIRQEIILFVWVCVKKSRLEK